MEREETSTPIAAYLALTFGTAELIRHAVAGPRRIYRQGAHYSKCGVMLTNLGPAAARQRELMKVTA